VWWYGFGGSQSDSLESVAEISEQKAAKIQVGELGKNLVAFGLAFHPFNLAVNRAPNESSRVESRVKNP
jgi:hypothetical protein